MQLIRIEEREGKKLVSGRELHEFLEVGRDFTTWIKARIEKYDFIENEDFTITSSVPQNGGIVYDYVLSMDMSKELSMVENNEQGRKARRYFIECEKQVKQLTELDLIIQSAQALKLVTDRLEDTENKVELLDKKFDSVVTLESGKQRTIQKAIACRVYDRLKYIEKEKGIVLGSVYDGECEKSLKIRKKLFSSIHRELKNKFGVSSYKDIKVADYELALNFINNWIESYEVREG